MMKKNMLVVFALLVVLTLSACDGSLSDVEKPEECQFLESKANCIVRLEQESNEDVEDEEVITEQNSDPIDEDVVIVQIDGYGSQEAFGDPLVGRKIVVRDDLEPNANGWYQRDIYEVTSLEELHIDGLNLPFHVEYERDYSQARRAWQPYFTMSVDTTVSRAEIEDFLSANAEVVATSVVVRIDADGNRQECSLKGLDPLAVRHVLYSGEGITFQTCDPSWSTP